MGWPRTGIIRIGGETGGTFNPPSIPAPPTPPSPPSPPSPGSSIPTPGSIDGILTDSINFSNMVVEYFKINLESTVTNIYGEAPEKWYYPPALVKCLIERGVTTNTNDDFGVFLGEDNKIGYVSSNRKSGGMDDDIYNFEILREVKRGKEVLFITKDKYNGEILPNTKFTMNGNSFETNEKGEYATTVEEDVNYSLVVDKVDYFKLEDSVSTKTSTEDAFTKELKLEKDPKVSLLAFITDAKTNKALDGVKITINELPSKLEIDKYTTEATGEYRKPIKGKKIGDKLRYFVSLEKDGYLTKTTTFVYEIKAPGEIKVNESINLSLGKVEVGMDLSKMIDMKPIYFDLGKSNIRWAASVELDKVVKVMTEYPNMYIQLGSHTDCRGAAAANAKLSSARAKSSADYIVKKGINKARIVGKGYGETKLLTGCNCEGNVKPICSEDEHAKNRRTEFVITKLK
jgi:outer membrane protein OmpA-like peptidoglycan-associated protein